MEVKSMVKTINKIEKFCELYCKPIKWVEELKNHDYTNFLTVYLIPSSLMRVSTNEISMLHGLVLLLRKRSLRNKKKTIVFHPSNEDFVLKLLFLVNWYIGFLKDKRKIFEDLKRKKVVSSLKDFSYLVFSSLVDLEDDEEEFQRFLDHLLPFFLKINKLTLKRDDKADSNSIKILLEEVRDNEVGKKEKTPSR